MTASLHHQGQTCPGSPDPLAVMSTALRVIFGTVLPFFKCYPTRVLFERWKGGKVERCART